MPPTYHWPKHAIRNRNMAKPGEYNFMVYASFNNETEFEGNITIRHECYLHVFPKCIFVEWNQIEACEPSIGRMIKVHLKNHPFELLRLKFVTREKMEQFYTIANPARSPSTSSGSGESSPLGPEDISDSSDIVATAQQAAFRSSPAAGPLLPERYEEQPEQMGPAKRPPKRRDTIV